MIRGIEILSDQKKEKMDRISKIFIVAVLCAILQSGPQPAIAQDASHPEQAQSDSDESDWGLLGLLGLVGLLGLRKKDRDNTVVVRDRTPGLD